MLISMTNGSVKSIARRSKRRPRGRPRDEALRARRCEEILDEAAVVFARHGFPDTDVQVIADALSISKGTVYRYFESKERLFLAAVARGVRQLDRAIESAVEAVGDPLDRMMAATTAYLKFFQEHPELVELFIQERAEFKGRKKPIYFEHGETSCAQWHDLIGGLIEAGRVRKMPVERVTDTIGDLLYGTMFTNHMVGRRKPFEEQAASLMDIFFKGILSDSERASRSGGGTPTARRIQ